MCRILSSQGVRHMSLESFRNDETLPEVTCEILRELLVRKSQAERMKKKSFHAGLRIIAAGLLVIAFFLAFSSRIPTSLHDLSQALRQPIVWLLTGIVMILLFSYMKTQRETTEAEDDFDELREQVIDRALELWPKEQDGHVQAEVMHELLDEKGINLFYK
jgi:Protein of unknown function (DUF2663).